MVIITVPLLFLLTLLSGVCPMTPKEYYVKAGDMVALHCGGKNHYDAQVLWKSDSSQEMYLYNNISAAEQRQMGVVVHGNSLVILSASVNHQGNYSCFLRSRQSWFRLTVYRTQSREYDETTPHLQTCYTNESCTLKCPDVLCVHTPNITRNGTTWYKNESSPSDHCFEIVNKNDSGNYTCIKHYLYHGQIYNETLNVVLDVQPNKKEQKHAVIASPREGEVFDVELGSTKVIDCVAETFSCQHSLFWLIEGSFVTTTESSRVFYKETCNDDSKRMTASLVFKEVLEEDLSKQYTCGLQHDSHYPKSVNITLTQKGVCPMTPKEYYVKAGDMVALHCGGKNHYDAQVLWKSDSSQEMYLYNNISAAEQRQMGVVVHGNSLVILSASVNHQGNYSCFLRSRQSWFRLTVYRTQSREYDETTQHLQTCYTNESCTLKCPDVLCVHTPNITRNGTTWYKNKSSPSDHYFGIVNKNDSGNYTCIKHYLYHGQIYNETLNVVLDVQPNKKEQKHAVIASPREGEVFDVELGSTKVIDCVAETFSCQHSLFWLIERSFVTTTESSRVFYKETCNDDSKRMTASLVFKEVLEEDLSKQYTCGLQHDSHYPKSVNITLTQKARPSYVSLASCFISMVVMVVVTIAIYVKFKVDIFLYLRDTLNCRWSAADEKSYDAYLMCYESVTDGGLNVCDRRWLENVLEERFGYHLCLYERDVLPGKAAAEAVLDCIEQSRTVVLVPTSADPAPGSGLLSAIHAALVERQTRLVFINTEMTQVSRSGSLPEALQILSEVGDCVTWKGSSSMSPSSSFWKQLRYYLPAPQK
ncbi:interleukin-1 receptor-like 1 [Brachyistius frenatus]|uniref:interleukin-1 receptor-like 1 n=1 Tax=Brachyistius frenatus TaxID=100188 RepID=UPI0037E90CA5